MFKNLLIDWVTELNEKIATVGDSGYLTISLSAFNPTLYAYPKSYSCESGKGGCGFTIWKSIAQKSITEAQVKKLLATGRSSLIKGFVSKAGKNFDAYLILKDDHQVGFEFPRGEKNEKARHRRP